MDDSIIYQNTMPTQGQNRPTLWRYVILVIGVAITLFVFYFLFSHSYLEVTLNNTTGQEVTYYITNQADGKSLTITSKSPTIKKMVGRGDYEVVAQTGDSSFVAVTKAKGLMQKSSVSGELEQERSRSFVGDNPGACMYYSGEELYSFGCNDVYSNITSHVPATSKLPTYIQKVHDHVGIDGYIEGVVQTGDGAYMLLNSQGASDTQGGNHTVYSLNKRLLPTSKSAQAFVDQATGDNYALKAYKSGFLVYNTHFDKTWYYPSLRAPRETVSLTAPDNKDFSPQSIETSGETIIALYLRAAGANDKGATRSEAVVQQGHDAVHVPIEGSIKAARLCGDKKLCLLTDDSVLHAYDISSTKPKQLFIMNNVNAVENAASGFIVVQGSSLINMDVAKQSGHVIYSPGDYSFKSLQKSGDNLLVSLGGNRGKDVTLLIDMTKPNADSIDQKVSRLQRLAEVTSVAAYGRYIYIAPNLGPSVYDPRSKIFIPDPKVQAVVNEKIAQEIKNIGFDTNYYTIINTMAH